jgi:hypothetical protein
MLLIWPCHNLSTCYTIGVQALTFAGGPVLERFHGELPKPGSHQDYILRVFICHDNSRACMCCRANRHGHQDRLPICQTEPSLQRCVDGSCGALIVHPGDDSFSIDMKNGGKVHEDNRQRAPWWWGGSYANGKTKTF